MRKKSILFILFATVFGMLSAQNNGNFTDFYQAVLSGETETVGEMLNKDPSLLEARSSMGSTALILSASRDHKELSKLLIKRGADVNAMNNNLYTPIHFAAMNGNIELVKILDKKGADLNKRTNRGARPLDAAVQSGNLELLKYFEGKGADLKAEGSNGGTLLHSAAHGGNLEMFKYLYAKGYDIHKLDNDGDGIMMWAASGGNKDIIEFLVKKENLRIKNDKGEQHQPIMAAINWGRKDAVEYFLNHGYDANDKLDKGNTYLHHAANNPRANDVVKLLVDKGAKINVHNNNGSTPLNWASSSRSIENVKYLLEKGAKINPDLCKTDGCEDIGASPLHSAAWRSPEVFKFLLEQGANVNAKTTDNETVLHFSAGSNCDECMKYAIKKGVDLDAQDNKGNTALHKATAKGKTSTAKLLIEAGANVNLKNKEGQTPLHLASIAGDKEAVAALTQAKANMEVIDELGKSPAYYASYYCQADVKDFFEAKNIDVAIPTEVAQCLSKELSTGEAMVWYTDHSGWAVKTKKHLLVFDYWRRGSQPENCCLNNGWVNPEELKDLDVYVFVSHTHRDHFDYKIFDWEKKLNNVHYVFGFDTEQPIDYSYVASNKQKKVGDALVTTIKSNDSGQGFLVEIDGLKILHPGDHANKNDEMTEDYKKEIDFLAEKYNQVDIAFFPISGCGFQNKKAVYGGVYYAMKKLSPKVVAAMHGSGREYQYKEFSDAAKEKFADVKFYNAKFKGDRFHYKKGMILAFGESE